MGPAAINVGKRPNARMECPSYTSNDNFAKELEDELMKFTTNYEDDSKVALVQTPQVHPPVGQIKEGHHNAAELTMESNDYAVGNVDITELNRLGYNDLVEGQSHETTESSSSFGGSGSDVDDFGDEALSGVHVDIMLRTRRKKLTPHWKAFIEPIMWRCKWTELQIKNLESQAKKYDKKLADYSQQKHIQFDNSAFEGLCVKSIPFPEKNLTDKVLKRKKRRRAESLTDLAAHMSNHNLFSYYENKKNITEAACMDKVKFSAGQKVKVEELPGDEFLWVQPGGADDSMEHMLQKIMSLESRVGKTRSRVDNIINANAGKFSELENLSLPISSTSSSQNTTPSNGGKTIIGNDVSSQFVTEHYVGDKLMPETAYASHENVTGSENLARFADALKNGKDDIVYTKKVKLERNNSAGLKNQPIGRYDEFSGSCNQLEEDSDTPMDNQPLLRARVSRHTTTPPTNDVRRGKRRRCVGRGNPRFSS